MAVKAIIIGIAGFAWVFGFRIGQRANAFERFVLSISLSVACALLASSLMIVARLPFEFVGYGILVLALGLLSVWLHSKPRVAVSTLKLKVLSRYWLPVMLFSFHLVLWTIYLINYPYFPTSEPIDAVWHAEITMSILHGSFTTPVGQAGFPAGAHILFAFVSAYFGVTVLTAERATAAFVESLSVLVAYCLFRRILPSKLSADYASVAFAVIIPAGLVYYARVGAYPNMVGDFFVLTSLLLAVTIQTKLTVSSVVTAFVVEVIALISHVSVLVFTMLVIGFSIVVFTKFRSQLRAYLISNMGFFLLPIAAIILASFLVTRELTYVSSLYLDLHSNIGLVLGVWLHNYLFLAGSLNFILVVTAFSWAVVKERMRIWSAFLAAWFAILFLLVFVGTQDWRMVLLSFVPGAGLLGIMLSRLQETLEKAVPSRIRALRIRRVTVTLLMLVLVVTLTTDGPSAFALSHAISNGQAARQGHIYDSMVWIQANTPPNSAVVSVGLQLEYRFLPIVTNLTYIGDFQLNASGILKLQSTFTFNYVTVSTAFSGLNTFYVSNAFRPAYQNPDVAVFLIVAS